MSFLSLRRAVCAGLMLLCGLPTSSSAAQQPAEAATPQSTLPPFPAPEKLTYLIEWHGVNAGTAVLQLSKAPQNNWQFDLDLQSAGLVSRLYRVDDHYKMISTGHFCALSTYMDAQEGKRHHQTQLTFRTMQHKVDYYEHDLVKNTTTKSQLNIAPCTHDVIGALATLRTIDLQPGKTAILPVTNGKKMVEARVDAQAKEKITAGGKSYQTVRYEAFLFDNVLYKRKGRLFLWATDDADRLPVKMQVQLGFPIGTVLLELEKREK